MAADPRLDDLVAQLGDSAGVTLHLDAHAAFTLAGALQLATRHPEVTGHVEALLVDTVNRIAYGMGGPVAEAIAAGWDTANDVDSSRP